MFLFTKSQEYIKLPKSIKRQLGILFVNDIMENKDEYIGETIYCIEIIFNEDYDDVNLDVIEVTIHEAHIDGVEVYRHLPDWTDIIYSDNISDSVQVEASLIFSNRKTAKEVRDYLTSKLGLSNPPKKIPHIGFKQMDEVFERWVKKLYKQKD